MKKLTVLALLCLLHTPSAQAGTWWEVIGEIISQNKPPAGSVVPGKLP